MSYANTPLNLHENFAHRWSLHVCFWQMSRMGSRATSDGVYAEVLCFQEKTRQRWKKNPNADVTCEWTLTSVHDWQCVWMTFNVWQVCTLNFVHGWMGGCPCRTSFTVVSSHVIWKSKSRNAIMFIQRKTMLEIMTAKDWNIC